MVLDVVLKNCQIPFFSRAR